MHFSSGLYRSCYIAILFPAAAAVVVQLSVLTCGNVCACVCRRGSTETKSLAYDGECHTCFAGWLRAGGEQNRKDQLRGGPVCV